MTFPRRLLTVPLLALGLAALGFSQSPSSPPAVPATTTSTVPAEKAGLLNFSGMADASAALPLGGDWFAVASDEFNTLNFHRWSQPGKPLKTLDLNPFFGIDPESKSPEADLEGVTRIGNMSYWISSHGRNKDGKYRPNRLQLFSLKVTDATATTPPSLEPVGKSYHGLDRQLADSPVLASLGLAKHLQLDTDKKGKVKDYVPLAPKDEGMNIEGLTATPDGQLLIGFRNPLIQGKAILVPVTNPQGVCEKGEAPNFLSPILLDLGGRAVRSIEWLPFRKAYAISAGPSGPDGNFALFLWSGNPAEAPKAVPVSWPSDNFKAEAMFADDTGLLHLLSDDGTMLIKGQEQKLLTRDQQIFRAFRLRLPER